MNRPQFESPLQGRLQSIDALRGIAALGVVLYHSVLQTQNAIPNNFLQWPVKLIQFISSMGYIGVFLFFVISGFCIHLQWAKNQVSNEPKPIKFGSFWRRRIRRLYPPYLITLAIFMVLAAATVGIDLTHFFIYDVVMHLLMLHNLDPHTCYSINGVFWTLAIEEQLYLAYFLLLFLRKRFGWGPTLVICGLTRVGWFIFGHVVWLITGFGIPVPEAAASHWFTWALGAIAVEAAFGLVQLPRWCRNLWLGALAIVTASAVSIGLPSIPKDTLPHDLAWMLMHPLWGFGFFVVVNRAVAAERRWASLVTPRIVTVVASLGVFSYSLYLTHELVIMQSWWFAILWLPPMVNTLLITVPATIGFGWVFYQFCEKPYMKKAPVAKPKAKVDEAATPVFVSQVPVGDEV